MRVVARLAICLSVLLATASAVELGLGVGRDMLYLPDSDSTVQPVALFAQTGFGAGRTASIRVSAGYAVFQQNAYDLLRGLVLSRRVDGVRVQATPFFTVVSPLRWLSLQGGLGLGGGYYEYRREYSFLEEGITLGNTSFRNLLSAVQTFTLGVECAFTPRISASFALERPGFRFSRDDAGEYAYNSGEGIRIPVNHKVTITSGWDTNARFGFGLGLHFRL